MAAGFPSFVLLLRQFEKSVLIPQKNNFDLKY